MSSDTEYQYAQAYLDRCKEIQQQANLNPCYKPQIQKPAENLTVIEVLDDDQPNQDNSKTTENTTAVIELLDDDVDNDLYITDVNFVREWIDISELDLHKILDKRKCNNTVEDMPDQDLNWADINVEEDLSTDNNA